MKTNPTYEKTFIMARRMNKNRLAASEIRQRYLRQLIRDCLQYPSPIADHWAVQARLEIAYLKKHEHLQPQHHNQNSPGAITEEMIERARNHPVQNLVQWDRNKRATAWCHMDKRPSLYYAPRVNKLVCPVCNKYFDSIAVLTTRDGLSFIDAVKELQ